MKEIHETTDEKLRLAKLQSYNVLDTFPEKLYDDITFIASYICDTPISLMTLVDCDRQWFKSKIGLDAEQTPRSVAFCAHAIKGDQLFCVPDATKDERFQDNPLVTDDPNIVFYAGAPIVTPEGYKMGTLCVIDNKPRDLNDEQRSILTRLSNQVASNLELRLSLRKMEKVNDELAQFAYRTSHDLKSPITSSLRLLDYIVTDVNEGNLQEANQNISMVKDQIFRLKILVHDIFSLVKAESDPAGQELVNVLSVVESLQSRLALMASDRNCQIIIAIDESINVKIQKARVSQVIENLVSNGIKYSDASKCGAYVKVGASKTDSLLTVTVEDNGVGIPEKYHKDVFELFTRFHPELSSGSGLGMSIVKKHVDFLKGHIDFSSSKNGTAYDIKIPLVSEGMLDE